MIKNIPVIKNLTTKHKICFLFNIAKKYFPLTYRNNKWYSLL